jgi:hypothetical protein
MRGAGVADEHAAALIGELTSGLFTRTAETNEQERSEHREAMRSHIDAGIGLEDLRAISPAASSPTGPTRSR